MVLLEGSGIVDVYIKHRKCCTNWNGGRGVIGLQNKTSSQIVTPPGRDFGTTANPITWDASGEAWRFTPVTPKPEFGELTWYENDVLPTNIISYSPTAKNQNIAVRPVDTTRIISEYIYTDALGNTVQRRDTTVINVTIPKIKVVSEKDPVCPNDSIFLRVDDVLDPNFTLGDISHCQWSTGKKDTCAIDTTFASAYSPGDTATFYVTVTFNNQCRRQDSVKVKVTNLILPTITSRTFVSDSDSICLGDTLILLATHPKTKDFTWSTGEISRTIKVSPREDSNYVVTATIQTCDVMDTFKVKVLPLPNPVFTPSPVDIIMDEGIGTVTCTTPLSPVDYHLIWNFNDTLSADNVVYDLDIVTHDYSRPQDYIISLTAIDDNNCDSTVSAKVSVKVPDLFYVPSAFTPNSDIWNERFAPVGQIVDVDLPYSMEIFDRFGMLMFTTNSPYDYWDGRNRKGEMCPEGVYVYRISFYHLNDRGNPDALQRVYTGTVTLLK